MGPRFRVSSERLEKPGIEPTTPGLEGGQLNHYATEASLQYWGRRSCLSDEILNRYPMTTFKDRLLTRTHNHEAANYAVRSVLCPRNLVFRHDLSDP